MGVLEKTKYEQIKLELPLFHGRLGPTGAKGNVGSTGAQGVKGANGAEGNQDLH